MPYISYPEFRLLFHHAPDLDQTLVSLRESGYIAFRVADSLDADEHGYETLYLEDDTHLVTLPLGNLHVEQRIVFDRRWKITTFIAVVAAIGAYRSELAFLIRVLAQLLIVP